VLSHVPPEQFLVPEQAVMDAERERKRWKTSDRCVFSGEGPQAGK